MVLNLKSSDFNYSFDRLDIKQILVSVMGNKDVQILANYKPVIYSRGTTYRKFIVTFDIMNNPYLDGYIGTIIACREVIKYNQYYPDGSVAETAFVKVDPNVIRYRFAGALSTKQVSVIFYETSDLISAIEYQIFPRGGLIQ